MDGLKFLRVGEDYTVAQNLSEFVNVVRDGWQRLDVDLVRIPTSVELPLFEVLPNTVRSSLVRHPVFFHEYPQVDVTASVSLTSRHAPEQNDAEDAIEVLAECFDSSSDRRLELGLRDFENRVVRSGEPPTVDTDVPRVPLALFDYEVVRDEDVEGFRNTGLRILDGVSEFRNRELVGVIPT